MKWRHMDEAPKDGTRVLVTRPSMLTRDPRVECVMFDGYTGTWRNAGGALPASCTPTAWMPLPEPFLGDPEDLRADARFRARDAAATPHEVAALASDAGRCEATVDTYYGMSCELETGHDGLHVSGEYVWRGAVPAGTGRANAKGGDDAES